MTKKTMCYTSDLLLSVALLGCKGQSKPEDVPASEALLGGWEVAEQEAGDLPEDAQKAFDAAKDKLSDGEYTPVSLLATQVVARSESTRLNSSHNVASRMPSSA